MSAGRAPWWDGQPDVLPPDPELEPLHQRDYQVRAWKLSDEQMLVRGAVMDLRPGRPIAERIRRAGGEDDVEPLVVHHMVVDVTVGFPSLTISDARVVFETFPQPACPRISDRYRDLIGVSIARGFTHEVRQRFGGPRGCTHTTALLQAMGPVAVQCMFSMRPMRVASASDGERERGPQMGFMRDTCHVWAEDGEIWQGIRVGRTPPAALSFQNRVRRAGLDPDRVDLREVGD